MNTNTKGASKFSAEHCEAVDIAVSAISFADYLGSEADSQYEDAVSFSSATLQRAVSILMGSPREHSLDVFAETSMGGFITLGAVFRECDSVCSRVDQDWGDPENWKYGTAQGCASWFLWGAQMGSRDRKVYFDNVRKSIRRYEVTVKR